MSALLYYPAPFVEDYYRYFYTGQGIGHRTARNILIQAFIDEFGRNPTLPEIQAVQAVASLESDYGQGWGEQGAGSNNWGAIQGGRPPCDANEFTYTDSHPDGSRYEACFRVYGSPEEGARALIRTVFKRNPSPLPSASRGNLSGFSTSMYESGYYEGFGATKEARIAGHEKAMNTRLERISKALNEPIALNGEKGGPIGPRGNFALPVILIGGAIAYIFLKRRAA